MLGLATVSMTLDTYSQVSPGVSDRAAIAMEDVLS
jgi:hypothetical protein